MPTLWNKYKKLVNLVHEDHEKNNARANGHTFMHALMVAQYAELIADQAHIGELTWIAGLLHNTDRLYQHEPKSKEKEVLDAYLNTITELNDQDKQIIKSAILEHSRLNNDSDDMVTITLKDADRLTNLGPNGIIRSGQFRYNLPVIDPLLFAKDPNASYKNPKTVYRDLAETLLWYEWLRIPKAKEIAKPYVEYRQNFMKLIEKEMEEIGLMPYPLEKW